MTNKKILVLGAGGFIGCHLANRLKKLNYFVRSVDIKPSKYLKNNSDEFLIGDLRSIDFCEEIFSLNGVQFDEVYQLAADMGGATYINGGQHDADVMSNSVLINLNIAKSCIKYNVKSLFFSSSACVYKKNNEIATCVESEAYPAFPDNEYGWEKLFSERMYKAFEKNHNLNVKIARFHSIVGPYSEWNSGKEKAHSALARKVSKVENGGFIDVIGDGNQKRTFLYVEDCVDGILSLMNSDTEEVINIGSDYLVSINQYLDILKEVSNKNFNINYVDGPTGVLNRYCNIEKAKKILNWTPKTSLQEATKVTYDWINSFKNE
jgi:nucleoside-diphosphate-sugar epimerase